MTCTAAVLAALFLAAAPAQEEAPLQQTSFENLKEGKISGQTADALKWSGSDKAWVTGKFASEGKLALHLEGGEDNGLEVELPAALQQIRGLSFRAERWTNKDPFKFRVLAQVNGAWKEVANLDQIVTTGKGFPTAVSIKLPEETIGALRFVCSAPEKAGVLIDQLAFLKGAPSAETHAAGTCQTPIRKLTFDNSVFAKGEAKTHTYRIPALITAANGDLLACCDARRAKNADLNQSLDTDIVFKRSSDGGKTWGPIETIIDHGGPKLGKACSDPSFILDRSSGEIFCFYNFMNHVKAPKEFRLHLQSSTDHGKTWSEPRDITDDITKPEWKMDFKFISSGRGVQTRDGQLLHTLVNLKRGLFLFGSKDHGKTWSIIDTPIKPFDEAKAMELADGSLMINTRLNGAGHRGVHRSSDHGKTWEYQADKDMIDPGCNGSIVRYTETADGHDKNRLLLVHCDSPKGRKNLVVKLSYDEGKTWPIRKVIDAGAAGYSDMSICADGSIGVLYEPGIGGIRFKSFTLEDLTDGTDKLSQPYKIR